MKKYVVKKGDTMWSISRATGVRLNLLMAANPQITDPNRLQPGQVIYIPELEKPAMPPAAATPPGGPLAGQLDGPPSAAPGPGPMPGAAYAAPEPAGNQVAGSGGEMPPYFGFVWPHVVQPGETWEHIAQRYGVSVQQLRRLNPTLGRALQEGDIVYVPGLGGAMPGQGLQPVGMAEPGFAPHRPRYRPLDRCSRVPLECPMRWRPECPMRCRPGCRMRRHRECRTCLHRDPACPMGPGPGCRRLDRTPTTPTGRWPRGDDRCGRPDTGMKVSTQHPLTPCRTASIWATDIGR